MQLDIRRHYACLDVSPKASAAEIKSAYRRLAKETHPDTGNSSDGGARFRLVTEAYETLGDASRRAAYDAECIYGEQFPNVPRPPIMEPLRCSACNAVTPMPRYVVFWRVYSVLLVSFRQPVQGIYCATCANVAAQRATLISSAAGWWAFPLGPFYTIGSFLTNVRGGTKLPDINESLLWHNARAFAGKGDSVMAYRLAERLLNAQDQEIATGAANLQAALNQAGMKQPMPSLDDPWSFDARNIAIQLASVSTVPLLTWAYIRYERTHPEAPSTDTETGLFGSIVTTLILIALILNFPIGFYQSLKGMRETAQASGWARAMRHLPRAAFTGLISLLVVAGLVQWMFSI